MGVSKCFVVPLAYIKPCMKRLLFLVFITLSLSSFSQKKMRVFMDSKQYYAPSIGNYLELQFEFDALSLNFTGHENGLIGEVVVNIEILQQGKSLKVDGYRLASPHMRDSILENFYDVRRFALSPGTYDIRVQFFDANSDDEGLSATVPVKVNDLGAKTALSPIQLVEYAWKSDNVESPFFKSGLEILPRISNYYPQDLSFVPFYLEAYQTNNMNRNIFGVRQRIIDTESDEELEQFTNFYRYDTSSITPILKNLDISNLYTGRYKLELAIIDENMTEVHSTSTLIERTKEKEIDLLAENVVLDPNFEKSIGLDSSLYYLGSLIPIAKAETQRIILQTLGEKDAQKAMTTIQSFWVATSGKVNAYDEWMRYKTQVQLVEKLYHTNFQDGYETDRGRVYLQYGSPTNMVQREQSASEYPYEIWQYNKIGRFSNKRFVFYNPDLIGNNYRLLHSDMIGEIRNNNWPLALNQRNTTNGNVDNPNGNVQQHYGGMSNDLFRQY